MVNAQTQIEIINADEISFNKNINENRQLLIGNVKTKHEDRFLICDSAYYYAKDNKIEAFNNIHIWQGDTLSLKGEYLLYHGDSQLAEIHKNIRFTHNNMKLTTEQLNYNFETNEGYFDTRAIITNKDKTLSSSKGIYYSNQEKFYFYDNVQIEDDEESIKADTIYYWLKTEFASFKSNGILENIDFKIQAQNGWIDQIEGNAFLSTKVKMTQLEDGYIMYADTTSLTNKMKESISYGNTLLLLPFNKDTLYITSDSIFNNQNTKLLRANNKASFKTDVITGKCDSLSFNKKSSFIYLNINPVLWLEEFQLTADTISLFLNDNKLEKAYLNKNSFISSKIDSNSFNQISGINMQANFESNELNSINVYGNGESIYYIQEDKTDEIIGLNKIICSNMNIIIENMALKNINFLQKPDATLFPIAEIKEEQRLLKHYKYHNKEGVLNILQTKNQVHIGF